MPILAARGKLFDRYGRLLVDNYPSTSCFLVREQSHNIEADLPLIAEGLHLDLDQLKATIHRYRGLPGYQPIPIKEDITADEVAFIAAHGMSCRSWRRLKKRGGSIRATGLRHT